MPDNFYRLSYHDARELLRSRLGEPSPGRIQLLTGPRQVGKTTLLLELMEPYGDRAVYTALDGPEAALPGHWDRVWARVEEIAGDAGQAVLLLDEIQLLEDWASLLKGRWDRVRRRGVPVHLIASGSSALGLASGSRGALAGRFERIVLAHWSAASLASVFDLSPTEAARVVVSHGSYPGTMGLREDPGRLAAYIREAIAEPALGRDLVAAHAVRKPALLRQVLSYALATPARIVSLQKLRGELDDAGALETIATYLELLEEAFLIRALPKYSRLTHRLRASPRKIVVLNNALLLATGAATPDRSAEPERYGAWVENACLAHAVNSGQKLHYWREGDLEVDGVIEGDWGKIAIEIKTGPIAPRALRPLGEFTRRHPDFEPRVLVSADQLETVQRMAGAAGFRAQAWEEFLLTGRR
jgi:predicted AAA+ superfamily ATPase